MGREWVEEQDSRVRRGIGRAAWGQRVGPGVGTAGGLWPQVLWLSLFPLPRVESDPQGHSQPSELLSSWKGRQGK